MLTCLHWDPLVHTLSDRISVIVVQTLFTDAGLHFATLAFCPRCPTIYVTFPFRGPDAMDMGCMGPEWQSDSRVCAASHFVRRSHHQKSWTTTKQLSMVIKYR